MNLMEGAHAGAPASGSLAAMAFHVRSSSACRMCASRAQALSSWSTSVRTRAAMTSRARP